MASEAQILANQNNAKKSTGPRTDAGKENSRGNAIKRGCSTPGPVADAARREIIDARKAQFRREIGQPTALQYVLIDQLAETTCRMEMCDANLDVAHTRQLHRAKFTWDADQRLEAALLAEKLAKKPQVVSLQLKATKHGCEHLINRWETLANLLIEDDPEGGWSGEIKSQALDMLGVERSHRMAKTVLDVPPDGNIVVHLREVIANEVESLNDAITGFHNAADEFEQETAAEGKNLLFCRDIRLLNRYRRTTFLEMLKLIDLIHGNPKGGKKLGVKIPRMPVPIPLRLERPAVEPDTDENSVAAIELQDEEDDEMTPIEEVLKRGRIPFNPEKMRNFLETIAAKTLSTPGFQTNPNPDDQTNPNSFDTMPLSITKSADEPAKPAPTKLNRAARRQLARKLATSGR